MAEVCIADIAHDFNALHAIGCIQYVADDIFFDRFGERRPPGAGIELQSGVEQLRPAANTGIHPRFVGLAIFTAEGRFRPVLPRYAKLFRREHLLPLLVALLKFVVWRRTFFGIIQNIIPVHDIVCIKMENPGPSNDTSGRKTNGLRSIHL